MREAGAGVREAGAGVREAGAGVREAGAGVCEAWCARGLACGSREARCQACLANGTRLYVACVTDYGEAGMLVSCTVG